MDYNTSLQFMHRRQFILYAKNRFLDKAVDFFEFNMADFDIDSYIADMEAFFDQYIEAHTDKDLPLRDN